MSRNRYNTSVKRQTDDASAFTAVSKPLRIAARQPFSDSPRCLLFVRCSWGGGGPKLSRADDRCLQPSTDAMSATIAYLDASLAHRISEGLLYVLRGSWKACHLANTRSQKSRFRLRNTQIILRQCACHYCRFIPTSSAIKTACFKSLYWHFSSYDCSQRS